MRRFIISTEGRCPQHLEAPIAATYRPHHACAVAATGPLTRLLAIVTATVALLALVAVPAARAYAATPAGDPNAYAHDLMYDHRTGKWVPSRWNPCRTIDYKINPGPLGATGISEARTAIAKVAEHTGLVFSYVGTTGYIPRLAADGFHDENEQRAAAGVPLVIAMVPRTATNAYDGASGRSLNTAEGTSTMPTQLTNVAVLVRPDAPAGFIARGSRGFLLLHELGQGVGLDHVSDGIQMMTTGTSSTVAQYNAGDITGLRKVGKAAGCLNGTTEPAPAPGPTARELCVAEQRQLAHQYGPLRQRRMAKILIARNC